VFVAVLLAVWDEGGNLRWVFERCFPSSKISRSQLFLLRAEEGKETKLVWGAFSFSSKVCISFHVVKTFDRRE